MRARLAHSITVALLTAGTLAIAPAASAAPVTPADFTAQLSAAVAASGVFTPGTTLVLDATNGYTETTNAITTNPDGSLTWRTVGIGETTDVRCVRVDRCWERSATEFEDMKWHRLPSDSVTYELGSTAWASLVDYDWSLSTSLDVGTDAAGVGYFTSRYEGVISGTDAVVTDSFVVGPSQVSYTLAVTVAGLPPSTIQTITLRSVPGPVTVRPPNPRTVGALDEDPSRWIAPINN